MHNVLAWGPRRSLRSTLADQVGFVIKAIQVAEPVAQASAHLKGDRFGHADLGDLLVVARIVSGTWLISSGPGAIWKSPLLPPPA